MADSAKEEAAKRRQAERERRQNRIKASSANRMAKITGVAGTRDYKEDVKPIALTTNSSNSSDSINSSNISNSSNSFNGNGTSGNEKTDVAGDPEVPSLHDLLNGKGPTDLSSLFAQLRKANPQAGFDGEGVPDIWGSKAMDANGTNGTSGTNGTNTVANRGLNKSKPLNSHYFDLMHLVLAFGLGLYAAFYNPSKVVPIFSAGEIVLLSLQLLAGQPGFSFMDLPFIGLFMNMLPSNRKNQLQFVGMFVTLVRHAYRDLAILVFAFGVATYGSIEYIRPIL
ncbi:hypothetical protein DASB73_031630 [Starmerella bacillaris]|uniref:Uncharacterized protein n=1 Tax=Starmerella bacillaris TaxID=1247836 RepID=A0AAV5RLA4_STABA|nr:hypothetical protein DASB73_031630 [Starmerella bacillaris]